MSLRAKLIWAFVLVAAGALLLAFATSNLGLHASMWAMHYRMHGAPMGWDVPLFLRAALTWSVWGSLAALGSAAVVGVITASRTTRPLRDLRDAAAQRDLRASPAGCRSWGRTRSPNWPPLSTGCATGWRRTSGRGASSWPTSHTNCATRWR
ncbi:HAMP domain-containing protein [Symbiobacterium thermophilum]|uniref:HAMP domain-containing protein n=1 Tax=Symbiobacterium thermophilum TaxID=2734 RepID=UPI002352E043|nr:hypothetical protein [Symbiobacterium thermophilum]